MASESYSFSSGIIAASFLGSLAVELKLTGHISWPWSVVLAPFWVSLAFLLLILAAVGVGLALTSFLDTTPKR